MSKHLEALKGVIFENQCRFLEDLDQMWYPYEVVELGAYALESGHEREFVMCTLLVLYAVIAGYDTSKDVVCLFEDKCSVYDSLPTKYSNMITCAYSELIT